MKDGMNTKSGIKPNVTKIPHQRKKRPKQTPIDSDDDGSVDGTVLGAKKYEQKSLLPTIPFTATHTRFILYSLFFFFSFFTFLCQIDKMLRFRAKKKN